MSGAMPYRPEDFGIEENFERRHYEREKLNRSWPFLLADFAVTTTVHGLRYLVEPTRYICRKFIWTLLITMSIVTFVYMVVTKLIQLSQYQTSVSLDIRYNESVVFPAVTVCNQCPYKLTSIQDLGLYDLLVNENPDRTSPVSSITCDQFFMYPDVCQLPDEFSSSGIRIGQVTRTVCIRFCVDVHDTECSSFVFNRTDNSCTLTAYNGEWLPPNAPNCAANNYTDAVEFYRRKRCTSKSDFYCNFENNTLCSLTNGSKTNETWSLVTASTTSTIPFDNTLNRASGHFQLMMTTDQRLDYIARLQSPYINSTDRCIELYFWMDSSVDVPVLSVISVSEQGQEDTVERTYGAQMPGWIRMYSRLPSGINRIVIEGRRGPVRSSGIAVDDIVVQKCTNFDAEVGCRVNPMGTGYMGTRSQDESGNQCLTWSDYGTEYGALLPDVSTRDSRNFCRNVLGPVAWTQPSCLVDQTDGATLLSPKPMPCNISFCGCRPGTSFVCANGMCLPRGDLVCDGDPDCSDASDEASCSQKTKISCDFEDGFRCGYVSTTVGDLSWRRWKASNPIGLTQAPNLDASGSLQGSYMLVSSAFGEVGDKVRLLSPLLNLTNATSLQFYYYFCASSPSDSTTQLLLYQMSILQVRAQFLFVIEKGQGQGQCQRWVRAEVCLPSGTFYLAFVATVGLPFVSDVAVDDIHLSDRPGCPEQPKPPAQYTPELVSASVNCSFSNNYCGYTYVTTSDYFELSRKPNIRIENYPKGVQLLCDSQGSIVSPDPCSLNGTLSSYLIWAPNGSMVTLSFTAFNLADDINCSRERLTISYYDETVKYWKNKATLCGSNRPQKMTVITSWTQLDYQPLCDHASRASGFNVTYRTSYPMGTDLTLVMKLNAQTSGNALSVTNYSYEHSVKLFSSVFELRQNACFALTFVALSRLYVVLAYTKDGVYHERLLHLNIKGFQPWSSLYYLQRNIPALSSDGQEFVLVLFAKSKVAGDIAYIDDIKLLDGSCPVQTGLWSGSCLFLDSNTCGFLDESDSGLSWVLVRNEGLRCEFDGMSRSSPSVLRSPPFLVDLRLDCFRLVVNLSSDSIHLNFTFVDTSGASFPSSPQVNIMPNSLGRYYLLPIAEHLNNSQVSLLIEAYLASPTYEYTYGYLSTVNLEKCPTTGLSTNLQDKVNCCEGFASTGYQFGQKWTMNRTNSTNQYFQWNVDSWYYEHPLDVDDVIMTPVIEVSASVTLRFSVRFPASNQLLLEVRATSELGLIQHTMAGFSGNNSRASTVEAEVCLPVGKFHLVFLVDCHNYVRSGNGSEFVRISGIEMTNSSCTVEENANDSECSGESVCLDRVIVSDSMLLAKSYSAGKPITIDADVLVVVRYDLVGSVSLAQSKETTIYLLSPSQEFTAVVDAWRIWQDGCSSDPTEGNVTVWTYEAGNLTEKTMPLSTFALRGNYSTSNGILQIELPLKAVNCLRYLNYSITPATTKDYFVTVMNRPFVDIVSTNQLTALWNSEEYILANDNLTRICVVLDFELSSSVVGVFLFEKNRTDGSVSNRKVFGSGSKTAKRIFARIQVELQKETSRIQLQVNFTKDTVIRQVKILKNSCTEDDPTGGSCAFQQLTGCGYGDASTEETHWTLASETADNSDDYSKNVDCSTYTDGRLYTGTVNRTLSGRTCQRWDQSKPHYSVFGDIAYFPDASGIPNAELKDVENYCRNPVYEANDLQAAPWCYTTDKDVEMEYCLVPYCQNYYAEAMFCLAMDSAVLLSPILHLNNKNSSRTAYRLQFDYRLSHPKIGLRVQTKASEAEAWRPTDQNLTFETQRNSSGWSSACFDLRGPVHRIAFVAEKIGFTQNLESASIARVNITKDAKCQNQGDDNGQDSTRQKNNVNYNGTSLDRLSYKAIVIEEKNKFNMKQLQIKIGHTRNDLIFKCTWGGKACNDSDIIREQTDLSVCYTFNGNSSNRVLSATNTGANNGLQLVLNIEQYENVPGMGINRGVKMHFRNQDDVPQVLNAGFMIPPGYQTLAQLEFSQSTSLEKPWGRCNSKTYSFFNASEAYTTAKCQLECKTKALINQCQCREPYMAPGPAEICNFSRHLNCARGWVDDSQCNCPDDCDVHSFTTSLSSSQFSNEVVDDISTNGNIQTSYWNALEISNRVDDETFQVAVQSMTEVVEKHQELLALTFSTVVDPSTSTTSQVLAAVKSLVEMAKADIVDGGRVFLANLKRCYDENVSYVVQSASSQLQGCSERLARMLVILKEYPYVREYYPFMSNAVNETQMLNTVLKNAGGAFSEAASKSYCPDNCLNRRCADIATDYDRIKGGIGGNISSIVEYGKSFLAALAATTSTTSKYTSTTTPVTAAAAAVPSPTNSSKTNTQPATTRPYQAQSTVGSETFPPQSAAPPSAAAAPPPASAKTPNEIAYSDWYQRAVAVIRTSATDTNRLGDCVTEYPAFLKAFGECLDTVDLSVSSTDPTVASSAVKTLSQDSATLKKLLADYLGNRITKRRLASEFLTDLGSSVTFHVDAAVSSVDSSVVTELTSIIATTEQKLVTAYGNLMEKLSKLQSYYLPIGSTVAEDYTRRFLIWRRPEPTLQDIKLTGYQLEANETYRTWPRATDLVAFTNGSAKDVLKKLLSAYDAILKQTVSNVQTQLKAAQQVVSDSVAKLKDQLLSFNRSTAIDENFTKTNIIKVDVFYGEMKYRTMQQSKGYDSIQFLSDFGGCFGLFLGGSVLSVFEFFDLLIYNVVIKARTRKINPKEIKVNPKDTKINPKEIKVNPKEIKVQPMTPVYYP